MKTCSKCKIQKPITDFHTKDGGKCEICGYHKCLSALELHHKDPNQKSFSISTNRKRLSKIKNEVDKCILICANCHKEHHYQLIINPKPT